MLVIVAALLCLGSGFLTVRLGWRAASPSLASILLQLSLAVGFGLGIFSIVFLAVGVCVLKLSLADLLVFVCLLAFYVVFCRGVPPESKQDALPVTDSWCLRLLTAVFAIASACAIYAAIMRALAHPHGDGWDAFAIWNLHARFLFLDGPNWREGFSPLIPWSHPDYPLLIPAVIAHFWTLLGHESQVVPAAVGLLFTFSTAGVLTSSLHILRGRAAALLGGLALLCTPAFIEIGTWQYADIPLSFFFLGAASLLCLHEKGQGHRQNNSGLLVLAGLSAAFATWTKNEGLLFFCSLIAARVIVLFRDKRKSHESPGHRESRQDRFLPFLLGAIPVLLVVLYFKRTVAPPNELFTDANHTLHKLLSGARYWAVIQWFVKQFFRFGHWLWIPITLVMVGYYFAIGSENRSLPSRQGRILRLTLLFTLAGYFVIYLNTPYEIYWHLRFSLNRLFLQLWPTAIFLFSLAVSPHGKRHTASQLGAE